MANRYAAFYAAFNTTVAKGNPFSKEEIVKDFTGNRTGSLQDLSDTELQDLVKSLNEISGSKYEPVTAEEKKCDALRKAIIAQFHLMYRTPSSAKAWAEKYGVNKVKRKFNDYTATELFLLVKNAEQVVADWRKSLSKKVIV